MNNSILKFPVIAPKLKTNCKHSKYIDLLSKIASVNNPVAAAKLAACIVIKNDIIAIGVNKMKTHPFQAKYGRNDKSIHLHAEIDVIKNAIRMISEDDLKKATLYICRVKYFDKTKKKIDFWLGKTL